MHVCIILQEADLFVPDAATVSGNCRFEDSETMTMAFKGFKLIWSFAKVFFFSKTQINYKINTLFFKTLLFFRHLEEKDGTLTEWN